ncbi:hypothetical protein BH23VER1_BH23VER1_03420 [soil metagenome]
MILTVPLPLTTASQPPVKAASWETSIRPTPLFEGLVLELTLGSNALRIASESSIPELHSKPALRKLSRIPTPLSAIAILTRLSLLVTWAAE